MKMPQSGELRERVEIFTVKDVPSGDAGVRADFAPVGSDFAKLEPVGETIMQGSVQTGDTITHRMTVRYRDDLTTRHVVEFEGQRYKVKRVTDLSGMRRFTIAMLELLGDRSEVDLFEPAEKIWQ
jgi:SPP1 family predicted phage head-tail adaptor